MLRRARGLVWIAAVVCLGGFLAGCGDTSGGDPKVTITSVEGDGDTTSDIQTAIIVRGENFLDGDEVEIRDAATGIRETEGVGATTLETDGVDTWLRLAVTAPLFDTGETKTIVSRDGVPKAIKDVTYLRLEYVAGAGIEIDDPTDTISTKLNATGGLSETLGAGTDELGLIPGTADDQILKWNDASSAWELGVDEGGAGSGTVDSVVAGEGIAVDAADPANPVVSLIDGTANGQVLKWDNDNAVWELGVDEGGAGSGTVDTIVPGAGIAVDDTDVAKPVVSLIDGTAPGEILKWDGSTWGLAVDETGGAGTDTLQDVSDRGSSVTLAVDAGDAIYVENTSATDGAIALGGYASGVSGVTYGVYGESASTSGAGVLGWAGAATGSAYGVYGSSNSATGYGVYADGNNVGLYASGVNKAAEFDGVVDVTGDVTITGTLDVADVTVGGALTLTNDPPGAPMEAATRKYVDDSVAAAGGGDITGVTAGAGLTGGGPGPGNVTLDVSFGAAAGTVAEGNHGHTLQQVCDQGSSVSRDAGGNNAILAMNTSSANNSVAVRGYANAGTGLTYGVHGRSDSTAGRGVYGQASAASGVTYGVYGTVSSTSGVGVYGTSPYTGLTGVSTGTTGSGYGVFAQSDSTSGVGVYGSASTSSGNTYGVYGRSDSASGRGVYGYAGSAAGVTYGVRGQSDSNSGYGVHATSGNIGLYATGTNKAAEFVGDVDVDGLLTADSLATGSPALKVNGTGLYGASVDFANGAWRIARDSASNDLKFTKVSGSTFVPVTIQDESFANAIVAGQNGVGIGTNNPTEMLDVNGTAKATAFVGDGSGLTGVTATEADTLHTVVNRGNTATVDLAGGGAVDVLNTSASGYGVIANASIGLRATGTSKAAVFDGQVDVNWSAAGPGWAHFLHNPTGMDLVVGSNGAYGLIGTQTNNDLAIVANDQFGVYINTAGDVGIKKLATAGTALDVLGTVNATAFTGDGSGLTSINAGSHAHALGDLSNVTATAEGSGGGLDADTVDGKHATAFADATHTHNGKPVQPADGFSIIVRHAGTGQFAYARIRADGTLGGAIQVIGSSFDGTVYRVTLTWPFDPNWSLAVVTPRGLPAPHTWTVDAPGGPDIFVYFFD